jgi:transglutaminase-like putative cysteine protease
MTARTRLSLYAAFATVLGSLALNPVFASWGWLSPVLGAVVVVALAGIGARRARLPQGLDLLASLVALLLFLTAVYAHNVAVLGIFPGPGALRRLTDVMSGGFSDIRALTAPAPVTTGLSLLTAGGVGLVAVVIDTLSASLRRPAAAGIPLLALFAVPAAILPSGVGWIPFVFSAAGYLALLMADGRERVKRWGRPLLRRRSSGGAAAPVIAANAATDLSPLSQAGRRIGGAAIALAVVVPIMIPGLHSGWFSRQLGSGSGDGPGGGGTVTTINPIVSLKRDLVESDPVDLIRYRTTDPSPDYLRLTTLDQFDGTEWRPTPITTSHKERITKGIPRPDGVRITVKRSVTSDIQILGLDDFWLPVPMYPTKVSAEGDWRYDPTSGTVVSNSKKTKNLSYTVDSNQVAPSAVVLNAVRPLNAQERADMKQFLELPRGVPAVVVEVADQVTAGAKTPYEQALALQEWFRSTFTYDLSVQSGNGDDALLSFLADKRGYCEQFASAMALMARILDIPARVDVGFTPGARQKDGTWVVTSRDAHAWPELWFPGMGWLRFEPTPTSDGRAEVPGYAQPGALQEPQTPSASPTPEPSPSASPSRDPRNGLRDPGDTPNPSVKAPVKARSFPVKSAVGGGLILVVLVLPYTVRLTATRRRWRAALSPSGQAHAAWDTLGEDVRDLGIGWNGWTDSPRRTAAELLATQRLRYDGAAQEALARLTRAEELARYAPTMPEAADVRADAERVRTALAATVPWQRRLRARVWPTSSVLRMVAAWTGLRSGVRSIARVLLRRN